MEIRTFPVYSPKKPKYGSGSSAGGCLLPNGNFAGGRPWASGNLACDRQQFPASGKSTDKRLPATGSFAGGGHQRAAILPMEACRRVAALLASGSLAGKRHRRVANLPAIGNFSGECWSTMGIFAGGRLPACCLCLRLARRQLEGGPGGRPLAMCSSTGKGQCHWAIGKPALACEGSLAGYQVELMP